MNTLALYVGADNIGGLIIYFVGIVLAVAITYAIMRACDAPPWMYKVAAILGLIVLLLIVVAVFFGGGNLNGGVTVHSR